MQTLLKLSCFDEKLIIASSNAAFLLNYSWINFNRIDLRNLRLSDVDLSGGTFIGTNLDGS